MVVFSIRVGQMEISNLRDDGVILEDATVSVNGHVVNVFDLERAIDAARAALGY